MCRVKRYSDPLIFIWPAFRYLEEMNDGAFDTAREIPTDIFVDSVRSTRNLTALHEMFIASGSHYPVEHFSHALTQHLISSPDPDMELSNLVRFSEATVSKASLFNDLLHYPVFLEVLMKLFGSSVYFADILVRDPELFRWLTASDVLNSFASREDLADEITRVEEMFDHAERRMNALKRLYRREILRIGARDILGIADLRGVTRSLSELADLLVNAALRLAEQQVFKKYGARPSTPFAVIGLGKLGGNELNYSSDIDILFVYEEEGEFSSTHGRVVTFHEYFNLLAEKIVQSLASSSTEGHLYRVDTRLRPESGGGPLARSLNSFLVYYESRGELWERQMLIKARPIAGDTSLANEFIILITPFVYPRTLFHHPAEYIARIKARIEASADEDNIKLQAGGIRDIEFIVQTLQLLNGGSRTSIRNTSTLAALEHLAAEHLLSRNDMTDLIDAYQFFRKMEHRLQFMLNTQTHAFPQDPRTQTKLARRMGYSSAFELIGVRNTHLKNVRTIFDQVLSADTTPELVGIEAILDGSVREEAVTSFFHTRGFHDVKRSTRNLMSLLSGSSLSAGGGLDTRGRDAFRTIAEEFFREVAQTPDPDMTLQNFTTFVSARKFPEQTYQQMSEPGFRKMIISVSGMSPRFTKGLAANPLIVDGLTFDVQGLASIPASLATPTGPEQEDLALVKSREELKAGIRYVLALSTFEELTTRVSEIADSLLRRALEVGSKKHGVHELPMAVFAVGKYGTREITFDSDLDIIFVADDRSEIPHHVMERIAAGSVQQLTEVSENGNLYNIDVRLRPEGKNSPLVISRDAHSRYLRERASLWERQAMTRLRFCCGDQTLGREVTEDVDRWVYDEPLPGSWVDDVVMMRRKIETRSRVKTSDFFDIKLGPGGMADVEFLAQMVQLKFGRTEIRLRRGTTNEILRNCPSHVIPAGEVQTLSSAYNLFRSIETGIRIILEDRSTILPEGKKLDLLGRCLAQTTGTVFQERVASAMKHVRNMFLAASARISES